jgi:DNA-directed RNA polymerase specialized sigma24 family protein
MHIFKRKNVGADCITTPSLDLDNLLKRYERDDCDAPGRVVTPVDDAERQRQILAALNSTDERTREIYSACRAGYTYAEIAAASGISLRAVKRCIARALFDMMESKDRRG